MTMPNPEERRIFMDAPNPTCKKCIYSDKKEAETPCKDHKTQTDPAGENTPSDPSMLLPS